MEVWWKCAGLCLFWTYTFGPQVHNLRSELREAGIQVVGGKAPVGGGVKPGQERQRLEFEFEPHMTILKMGRSLCRSMGDMGELPR